MDKSLKSEKKAMPKTSPHTIYNIIAKKFTGQANELESKKFDEWLNSNPESGETLHDLNGIWSENLLPEYPELVSQREVNEKICKQSFEKKSKISFRA